MEGTAAAVLMGDLANGYDKIADKNERQVTKTNKPKQGRLDDAAFGTQ